jgi:DNA-binding CsgD family transcriptional regulator
MYSVKILDNDGLFSGISMKRRTGRPRFTARERRMLHIVSCAVDSMHVCSETLAAATYQVRSLTPRQQNVLTLILKGRPLKHVAEALGIKFNTLGSYTKEIYRHFGVNSRVELIARLQSGDGEDLA